MVDFAGWEMPVQYTGAVAEHLAVREAAGLFDVSHMGEVEIIGPRALDLIQQLTTNDASKVKDNQAQYSLMTNDSGGVIDDLIVYRLTSEHFLLVVNAANCAKDFAWISGHAGAGVEVNDVSEAYALLAIQGPRAEHALQELTDHMLDRIPYYWSQQVSVDGVGCRVSRTGYTGEDGFEIFCDPSNAVHLWNRLLITGQQLGVKPCGLASRNTLRLEAAFRLWGHDMDETTTPLEAGLAWCVKLDKPDFVGRNRLIKQKQEGLDRKLVGFEVMDRAPARDGYPIKVGAHEGLKVASGSPAPYLKKNIGLAYMPIGHSAAGSEFSITIRGRDVPARVVRTPFYKREKKFD
jgi:glycine cleavage system T protein (aminomethyltransferase)